MTGWLKLTDEQRSISLRLTVEQNGASVKAIEKDWWVILNFP